MREQGSNLEDVLAPLLERDPAVALAVALTITAGAPRLPISRQRPVYEFAPPAVWWSDYRRPSHWLRAIDLVDCGLTAIVRCRQ